MVDEVLVVIVVLIRRLPLDRGSRRSRTLGQGVLDCRFDVVLLRWRGRNRRKVVTLIGNRGEICRLLVIVRCSPCNVRRGRGYRVSWQLPISAAVIVDDWVVLSATDGCSNVTDGAEIPEVFWVAVVLAVGAYISTIQRNVRESRTRRNPEPVRGRQVSLRPPLSTFRVVRLVRLGSLSSLPSGQICASGGRERLGARGAVSEIHQWLGEFGLTSLGSR